MCCISESSNSISAVRAMAKRWSTALVEPPNKVISLNAFSSDFLVTMSLGFRSNSSSFSILLPATSHSMTFSALLAGLEELYGRVIPIASMALAMVLAVYIPPQAPGPGHACLTISLKVASSMAPDTFCPHASKAETTSNFCPL